MTMQGILRSAVDGRIGYASINAYGCHDRPVEHIAPLGSCTASTPTLQGWEAAEKLWESLRGISPWAAAQGLRDRVAATWRLPAQSSVVLMPSGTDTALLALALAQDALGRPVTSLLTSGGEIGSGTALAASGRHFSRWPPLGPSLPAGSPINGLLPAEVQVVPARDATGEPLSEAAFHEAVDHHRAVARQKGHALLLHHVPCSKTGLAAPEPVRWPASDGLVLVDAAQGRCSPAQLGEWLRRGWMVSITGSKFFEAPPFCGALILPLGLTATRPLPPGLNAYLTGADLPRRWPTLPGEAANPGLLLRWAAGIQGMEAFHAEPDEGISAALLAVNRLAEQVFTGSIARLLPTPHRTGPAPIDRLPSFFNIELPELHGEAGEARALWRVLRERRPGWHIGQPVSLGHSGRIVLRVAPGASTYRTISSELRQSGTSPALDRLEAQLLGLHATLESLCKADRPRSA